MTVDLDQAREALDSSTDFTIGLEEEFSLLDPSTLSLHNEFERLKAAAVDDEVLATSLVGELISSEVEIRSGRGQSFDEALDFQRSRRRRLFSLATDNGIALAATGAHPWSPWQEQHIIDTPHYRLVADGLQYVAWRNNTFSSHVHVGVRGADRAVAACDAMRPVLPVLLAASANSAFLEGTFTGLHSARTQVFTKSFPRCGVPDALGSWEEYERYVRFLVETNSIVENTQVWWSVRPHFSFGTVEVRIMDAQSRASESTALLALAAACVAQAAIDFDHGKSVQPTANRLIEENMWRAIRFGLDGDLIDLDAGREIPAVEAVRRLVAWTGEARAQLGLDSHLEGLAALLEDGNGAQRQWRAHESGVSQRDIFAQSVAETCESYAEAAVGAGACSEIAR
ncbi:MAG: YbdK family carboxylate-amine ligase [Solirubrobacterales bacterium]